MLVLASASPRRQELLRAAGIPFEVQPAHIAEVPLTSEKPKDCAERLAREKALAVAQKRPNDTILGADTVVVIDDQILGKPADAPDAARMLRMLSGRTHQVITGVCLVKLVLGTQFPAPGQNAEPVPEMRFGKGTASAVPPGATRDAALAAAVPKLDSSGEFLKRALVVSSETTLVTMSDLTEKEISDYVATGEPMDKAGAYAIQGIASRWIPRIEGDYGNVVGLPVALVHRMMGDLARK